MQKDVRLRKKKGTAGPRFFAHAFWLNLNANCFPAILIMIEGHETASNCFQYQFTTGKPLKNLKLTLNYYEDGSMCLYVLIKNMCLSRGPEKLLIVCMCVRVCVTVCTHKCICVPAGTCLFPGRCGMYA